MRTRQRDEDRNRTLFGEPIAPIMAKYRQTRPLGVDDPVFLPLDADDPHGRAIAEAGGRGPDIVDFVDRAARLGVLPETVAAIEEADGRDGDPTIVVAVDLERCLSNPG